MPTGHFRAGNKAAKGGRRTGAGRKPDQWKRMFNRALSDAVADDDLDTVLDVLVAEAKAGEIKAVTLLLAYVAGKPIERQEVSGPDGAPVSHTATVQVDLFGIGSLSDSELAAALAPAARALSDGGIPAEA